MSELMRAQSKSLHWTRNVGYIKGSYGLPVCGIADKVDGWMSTSNDSDKPRVTCEHCLYWLWEQEQPARKLDVNNAVDERIVNMHFDNRTMSAHDFEEAVASAIRKTSPTTTNIHCTHNVMPVENDDFRREFKNAVKEAVAELYQLDRFREDVKAIHKEAEEELDQEWEDNGLDDEDKADRLEEIRNALSEVLNRARPLAPQNIYMEIQDHSPKPLSATDIMRLGAAVKDYSLRKPSPAQQFGDLKEMWLAMLDESDFRVAFKQIMKEALEEDAVETEQDQRRWMIEVLNKALDDRSAEAAERARQRWIEAWGSPDAKPQFYFGDTNITRPKAMTFDDNGKVTFGSDHDAIVQKPVGTSSGLAYYEDPPRPWYKRIFNRFN